MQGVRIRRAIATLRGSSRQASAARCRCARSAEARERASAPPSVSAEGVALLDWARARGANADGVRVADFDDGAGGFVRGVAADQDVAAGAIVAEIPRALALEVTTDRKARCPVPGCDRDFWREQEWWCKLAVLLLLRTRARDSAEDVAPYARSLPPEGTMATPFHWSDAQLAELHYPPAVAAVAAQRAAWGALYDDFTARCASRNAALRGTTPGAFFHAIECVRSRTFSGPYEGSDWEQRVRQYLLTGGLALGYVALGVGPPSQALNGAMSVFLFILFRDLLVKRNPNSVRYVLCPVLDMFNHSSGIESEVSYEYFRNTFALRVGTGTKQADEVFISYGKRSNDELLQYYGFVEDSNPHDRYVVCDFVAKAIATIESSPAQGDSAPYAGVDARGNAALLEANGLASALGEGKVALKPPPPPPNAAGKRDKGTGKGACTIRLPSRVMQAVRVLAATADELKGRTPLLDFAMKVSEANEERAHRVVADVCARDLAAMPTTEEEDRRQLARGKAGGFTAAGAGQAATLALRFRIQKKALLGSILGN